MIYTCKYFQKLVLVCIFVLLTSPAAWSQDIGNSASGKGGAVSSGDPDAVQAGIGILEQGGNAADAAAATIFALAITDFGRFAMGGEAPLIIYNAISGEAKVLSGVGRAPLNDGDIDWYYDNGIPTNGDMKAAPTPGVVHMLMTLLEGYGTMSFERVIEPTLALLDEGGQSWYPRLATTLRKMVTAERNTTGSREAKIGAARNRFYTGDIANDLEDWYIAKGGFLRKADLAAQVTHIENPVTIEYRGYTILKADTWTQGPMLLQTLRLLESFDLAGMGHLSADYIHVVTEAMKLAFADRDEYYGDPLLVDVPLTDLLSDEYTNIRVPLIDMSEASQERRPGNPSIGPLAMVDFKNNAHTPVPDTTTLVVADRFGNFVAATPSCNVFGNKGDGGDTGVTHGNRLRSLNNALNHPNRILAGKRPRITLTPTMVIKNGQPLLGISVAGGDKQEPTSLNVLLNVLEFGMLPAQAVTEPRFSTDHRENSFDPNPNRDAAFGRAGDLQINTSVSSGVRNNLASRGHNIRTTSGNIADPSAIFIDSSGIFYAAGDPDAGRHANAIAQVQAPIKVFNFNDSVEGFVYLDDAFRNTNQPIYASGSYTSSNGFGGGGGLQVIVGGINNNSINGMSGGWENTFELSDISQVTISIRYRMTQNPNYESDEFSQVLVMVDNIQVGSGGNDYVTQINGNGNGGSARTTTWKLFQANVGTLNVGNHTITVGGYNNKKTYNDESTEILIDAVVISTVEGGTTNNPPTVQFTQPPNGTEVSGDLPYKSINAIAFDPDIGGNDGDGIQNVVFELINSSGTIVNTRQENVEPYDDGFDTTQFADGEYTLRATANPTDGGPIGSARITLIINNSGGGGTALIDADFESGTEGFSYQDNTFRDTSAGAYASGTRVTSGGNGGAALRVILGGVDNADIFGMSGGWQISFSLSTAAQTTLEFDYKLTINANYESDEYGEVLVTVDSQQPGSSGNDYVARVTGNGNGGANDTTGWQTFTVNLGTLSAGSHTLTLGGYNNKKTYNNENSEILIDNVSVTAP